MKYLLTFPVVLLFPFLLNAQLEEKVYKENIRSVQLHFKGNQLGFPLIRLHTGEQLELHFDDLDGGIKNYSYTFQLCNADWTPAIISSFDYIRGFTQNRITQYRVSNYALTKYTHYQAEFPDRNMMPTRSGNYLLKVFENGDTSKLLFTKKFLVVEDKSGIRADIQQPFTGGMFRTHQKVMVEVTLNQNLNIPNPHQQIKLVILQNGQWTTSRLIHRPSFVNRNVLQYNNEQELSFPGSKEWRWADLRSFRFLSEKIANARKLPEGYEIFLHPETPRKDLRFNFYRDINGKYTLENTENLNPYLQGDYAIVHFSLIPTPDIQQPGKEVYIFGELTGYRLSPEAKMEYDSEDGLYKASLKLKQGYYDYQYVVADREGNISFEETEGSLWETENDYLILVYYINLSGRADELIGVRRINSQTGRRSDL